MSVTEALDFDWLYLLDFYNDEMAAAEAEIEAMKRGYS